ncbi:MAG TPA: hypothetical protein DCX21_03660 [Eubacterium sp.]|nr:hypothetical protein [Eubacterium sp.]HBZ52230.1 hypothetical protein [Eubacterium sp.]
MYFKKCLRELTIYYVIPFVLLWVIIPWLMIYAYKVEGIEGYKTVVIWLQLLIPAISIVWPFLSGGELISGDGCELMYTYRRVKIERFIIPCIVHMIVMVPLFIIANELFVIEHVWYEYIRVAIVCFALIGFYYFFSYQTANILVSTISIVVYISFCLFNMSNGGIYNYIVAQPVDFAQLKSRYIPILVAGCLFYVVGVWKNLTYKKFN